MAYKAMSSAALDAGSSRLNLHRAKHLRLASRRRTRFRAAVVAAAGLLGVGLLSSASYAQPAPFFSALGSPSWGGGAALGCPLTVTNKCLRVSPSGNWVLGSQSGDNGIFLWERASGLRFEVPVPSPGGGLAPVAIDERLPIVAADGPTQTYLLASNGGDWLGLGNFLGPQYANVRVVGFSDRARVIGLSATDPATGLSKAIALENGVVVDVGAEVQAQLDLPGGDFKLVDVATGRPTSIGTTGPPNTISAAWLYDHPTGRATQIFSPTGGPVIPIAVSEDGVAVTGAMPGPGGALVGFYWTRRGSPLGGGPALYGDHAYVGTITPLVGLAQQSVVAGTAIDAAGHNVSGVSTDVNQNLQAVVWRNFAWGEPVVLHDQITDLFEESGSFVELNHVTDMSPEGVMTGVGLNLAGSQEAFAARLSGGGCKLEFDFVPGLTFADLVFFYLAHSAGWIEADLDLDGVVGDADIQAYEDAYYAAIGTMTTSSGCN